MAILAARRAVAPSLARGLGARRKSPVASRRTAVSAFPVRADATTADQKVVVITGANTGLGFISATEIARDPSYKDGRGGQYWARTSDLSRVRRTL